ncbi:MAG: carbon-nitrogen hydrolase family protein [Bacteroidota bacterium]|mgnify:CR=1 FL=1
MKIALAQCQPKAGDVAYNSEQHRNWIRKAQKAGADLVVFPELSLTGYEPDLAAELAVELTDELWQSWQQLSDELTISFGMGMPIRMNEGIVIGLVLFQPQQPHRIYAKQYLHVDEEPYFVPGTVWDGYWAKHQLAFAICYEISVPAHAEQAVRNQAQLYLASVAKFENGIASSNARLAQLARTHRIHTMMVNAVGPADNGLCVGQTAVWDREGQVINQLGAKEEACLLLDTDTEAVTVLQ